MSSRAERPPARHRASVSVTTIDPEILAAILRDQITEEEDLCRGVSAEEELQLDALAAKRLAFADAISTMSAEELSVTLRIEVQLGEHGVGSVELTSDLKLVDFLVLSHVAKP
jgi:hypothetical protein